MDQEDQEIMNRMIAEFTIAVQKELEKTAGRHAAALERQCVAQERQAAAFERIAAALEKVK